MSTQLRTIYYLILQLEATQENLYKAALEEHRALTILERESEKLTRNKKFAQSLEQDRENKQRALKFQNILNTTKHQIKQISFKYRNFVEKYLKLLASSSDQNLQLLSVRLNFNDYYAVA